VTTPSAVESSAGRAATHVTGFPLISALAVGGIGVVVVIGFMVVVFLIRSASARHASPRATQTAAAMGATAGASAAAAVEHDTIAASQRADSAIDTDAAAASSTSDAPAAANATAPARRAAPSGVAQHARQPWRMPATSATRPSTSAPEADRPAEDKNCAVPYYFDSAGLKRYKYGCVP
jgi:hypothetical protein